MIAIEHLTKTFPGASAVTALADVSLSIESGEIFGIIGLSGAGKSTLVRCMNLLERPTSGSVRINGAELTKLPERELRKARQSIGMIFQSFNLLDQRTALDNVCFPLELSGMSRSEARKKALPFLKLVGLENREKAYPVQLSGGQKQRVAIARTLVTDPKVILCDEATSALDPTTTQAILALLKKLNEKLGVTVVVITHEMTVVEQICDRVAIIADSHIVEQGVVADVFHHPKTAEARQLITPKGAISEKSRIHGPLYRITFDGNTSDQPVVSGMVLTSGAPVNIWYADTKDIDGKAHGQMLLELPKDPALVNKMLAFLKSQHVTYEKEEAEYYG
ncbi:methionine ABC transporter ATP-binding protein [Oscillibacter valericigenes Sjm18-20]|nr:methionine ABC transporter ATP-binding protein [Oscillibacter valericigenes Sjm18-20]